MNALKNITPVPKGPGVKDIASQLIDSLVTEFTTVQIAEIINGMTSIMSERIKNQLEQKESESLIAQEAVKHMHEQRDYFVKIISHSVDFR